MSLTTALGVPKVPLRPLANDRFLLRLSSDLGCVLVFRIHCQEAAVLRLSRLGCVTFFVYVLGLFSSPLGAPKVPLRTPANQQRLCRSINWSPLCRSISWFPRLQFDEQPKLAGLICQNIVYSAFKVVCVETVSAQLVYIERLWHWMYTHVRAHVLCAKFAYVVIIECKMPVRMCV